MEREYRYMVFKLKDVRAALSRDERALLKHLAGKVHDYRLGEGKAPLECVVVESDWPEYEPTWQAIEQRMDETPNEPAQARRRKAATSTAAPSCARDDQQENAT